MTLMFSNTGSVINERHMDNVKMDLFIVMEIRVSIWLGMCCPSGKSLCPTRLDRWILLQDSKGLENQRGTVTQWHSNDYVSKS